MECLIYARAQWKNTESIDLLIGWGRGNFQDASRRLAHANRHNCAKMAANNNRKKCKSKFASNHRYGSNKRQKKSQLTTARSAKASHSKKKTKKAAASMPEVRESTSTAEWKIKNVGKKSSVNEDESSESKNRSYNVLFYVFI